MSVLDHLKSAADALSADKITRAEHGHARATKRPDWLPEDWPDDQPFVSLAAAYAGSENAEAEIADSASVRVVDPNAAGKLTDAQVEGWRRVAAVLCVTGAGSDVPSRGASHQCGTRAIRGAAASLMADGRRSHPASDTPGVSEACRLTRPFAMCLTTTHGDRSTVAHRDRGDLLYARVRAPSATLKRDEHHAGP